MPFEPLPDNFGIENIIHPTFNDIYKLAISRYGPEHIFQLFTDFVVQPGSELQLFSEVLPASNTIPVMKETNVPIESETSHLRDRYCKCRFFRQAQSLPYEYNTRTRFTDLKAKVVQMFLEKGSNTQDKEVCQSLIADVSAPNKVYHFPYDQMVVHIDSKLFGNSPPGWWLNSNNAAIVNICNRYGRFVNGEKLTTSKINMAKAKLSYNKGTLEGNPVVIGSEIQNTILACDENAASALFSQYQTMANGIRAWNNIPIHNCEFLPAGRPAQPHNPETDWPIDVVGRPGNLLVDYVAVVIPQKIKGLSVKPWTVINDLDSNRCERVIYEGSCGYTRMSENSVVLIEVEHIDDNLHLVPEVFN